MRQTAGRIRQREQDNESLRQHGYRWERRWRDGQTQWRLLDGSGRVVRKENALEELHRAVYEGSEEEFW